MKELDHLPNQDMTIKAQSIVDIRHIKIDTSLPVLERFEKYLKDVQNPYYFSCGDVSVHVCFSDEDNDLSSQLKHYFSSCNR